jgi:stage III sporulation protein AB
MRYRRDPLPETFERVSKYKANSSSAFFLKVNEILKENKTFLFMDSWKMAADECYKNSSLKPSDIEIINDIGIELGKSDIEGQANLFFRTFKRLEECTQNAVLEKNTKGKMYKSMGITIGIVIVIILI